MAFDLTLNNIACEIDDRVLFSGLSATFSSGDLVQIVGPNGAGKTTLLKILTGISGSYTGELRWCNHPIPSYDFYTSLMFIGHATGVKTSLTPLENLCWYFALNGRKGDSEFAVSQAACVEALANVGLAGYEQIPSEHMSAGQQRRVALARLYLSEAPLWILDEPFTAIDKQGAAGLESQLNRHRHAGGIVILTTHQSLSYTQPKVIDLAHYAGGVL